MVGLHEVIHQPMWIGRLGAGRLPRSVGFARWSGLALLVGAVLTFGPGTTASAEAPKRGGVLTYMIPADAGPEPRWAPRDNVRGRACDGAVLQRADPRQSRQPVLDHGLSCATFAPRCQSQRTMG